MRADARRNLERILAVARDAFIELGADAPLEEIARRAGVGIATLYRRFPDRAALMQAVVLDVLGRVGEEARTARAEEPDAFRALSRYMHRALDLRIAAVMPALVGHTSLEDEEILRVRHAAAAPVEELIRQAQAEGTLRSDVAFGDIGLMIVRMARPLPGSFSPALNDELAHRHLDLVIDGLRGPANRDERPVTGPALSLKDLQTMTPDHASDATCPAP